MNILIVDDEQPARKKIRAFLKEEAGIDAVFEAANGIEAVKCIREKKPDVVLLDIQMPGMTGIEVIATIGAENMPAVIFVTAYDQYALAAFEVQAVDYLLKPFDQDRFHKSFRRAVEPMRLKSENAHVLQRMLAEINKEQKYLQRILVNSGARYFFVKTGDLQFVSAEEKYVKLHTEKGGYLLRETMKEMEQRLDPSRFSASRNLGGRPSGQAPAADRAPSRCSSEPNAVALAAARRSARAGRGGDRRPPSSRSGVGASARTER